VVKLKEFISYYFKPFFFATLLFFLLFVSFQYALVGDGIEVYGWKVLRDKSNIFTESALPKTFYRILKHPSTVVIRALVNYKTEETDNTRYLYIPQIDASYFVVKADDKVIGSFGFSEDRTGHVWYQPFIFQLPERFDTIDIELSGIYEVGIDFPVKIISDSHKLKYSVLYLLTSVFLPISTGLTLTLSIILYLISRSTDKIKREVYRHLSIASFLGGIWMFDLFPFPSFGNTLVFLLMRKIFVISAYLGFAALIYGINREYFEKFTLVDKIIISLNFIAAILVAAMPSNYAMKVLTNNISLILIVNAAYLFVKTLRTFSQVLFGFVFFFVLTITHDGLSMFFSTNSKLLSAFGIVSLFAGFAYTLVNEYKEMVVRVTMSHMKSITDPLTGAYNRGYLSETLFAPEDAFVYVDMDKFKSINDNHGHDVGDEILRLLVRTIKNNIRSSDFVIRMGGDEFLVILRGCPVEKATEIFTTVSEEFKNSHELRPGFSFGIVQFSGTVENTLRAVDDLMYKMKESKRR